MNLHVDSRIIIVSDSNEFPQNKFWRESLLIYSNIDIVQIVSEITTKYFL